MPSGTLIAEIGNFSLTGIDSELIAGRVIYVLTGLDADLSTQGPVTSDCPDVVCGDPFIRATRGFLNKDGTCGTPISTATRGFLVTIQPDGDGGYKIRGEGKLRGLTGGGILPPPVRPLSREIILEEEEEILFLIGIFLQQIANRVLK